MPRKKEIDKIDSDILSILQLNASMTNRELAKKIGLTPGPTLVRMKNLEKRGYLKSSCFEINWKKLNYNYSCTVISTVFNPAAEAFEQALQEVEGIIETVQVSRDSTIPSNNKYYRSKCIFKSEEEFMDVWAEIIASLPYPIEFQLWETIKTIATKTPIQVVKD